MIQILALLGLAAFTLYSATVIALKSGTRLHQRTLFTVMSAPLTFFTTMDIGRIINHFSQDMTIIDGELSNGLSNTILTTAFALGQAVVIAVASPYMAIGSVQYLPRIQLHKLISN